MQLIGNWERALARLTGLEHRIRVVVGQELPLIGAEVVASIRDEMARVGPALHPFTVEQKGSSAPLIDGPMERALAFRVEPGLAVFVGLRGRWAYIGAVHEYGMTIGVTRAMRGYLHAQGLHLAADTEYITIPQRPFIRPGLRAARPRARARLKLAYLFALGLPR